MSSFRNIGLPSSSAGPAPCRAGHSATSDGGEGEQILVCVARTDRARKLQRVVWGAALALIVCLFTLAINTEPAAAAEPITSFRTTLIEAGAFGESSKVFYGVVNSAPSGEGFTIETTSGGTDTIVVYSTTKISGHGYEEIGLNSISSGEPVAVIGALSGGPGGVIDAARIFVEPNPGEVEIPAIELVTEGVVQTQPGGESFTIETNRGAIDTVEVSPSTTYSRARPVPGIPPPTLSDVRGADFVGVSGTIWGQPWKPPISTSPPHRPAAIQT